MHTLGLFGLWMSTSSQPLGQLWWNHAVISSSSNGTPASSMIACGRSFACPKSIADAVDCSMLEVDTSRRMRILQNEYASGKVAHARWTCVMHTGIADVSAPSSLTAFEHGDEQRATGSVLSSGGGRSTISGRGGGGGGS